MSLELIMNNYLNQDQNESQLTSTTEEVTATSSLSSTNEKEDEQQAATTANQNNKKTKEEIRPNSLLDVLTRINDINLTDTCPICLLQIQSETRSYTNTCYHCFCFECLFEWSKIKANCPLCKQQFKLIYYEIKSIDDYKEFRIKPNLTTFLTFSHFPFPRVFSFEFGRSIRETFLTRFYGIGNLIWSANKDPAPEQFRLTIYTNKLYVSPNEIELLDEQSDNIRNTDCTTSIVKPTRYRDINAKFYRDNPACMHRLVPFINREFEVIKRHYRMQPKFITSEMFIKSIFDLLKKYDINSKQFLLEIKTFIRPNHVARHFQHEFYTFARSFTQSLPEYDAKCVYYGSNFTKRVDMSMYRKYENLNVVSTHVRTMPPQLSGAVDELIKNLAEDNEVIKIDDDVIIDEDNENNINNNTNERNDNDVEILSTEVSDENDVIIIPIFSSDSNVSTSTVNSLSTSSTTSTTSSSTTSYSSTTSSISPLSIPASTSLISSPTTTLLSRSASRSTLESDDVLELRDENSENTVEYDAQTTASSFGDSSSFCEVISEPQRETPECIYLSSDENTDENSSRLRKKRKLSLAIESNSSSSSSSNNNDQPTTSARATRNDNKNTKKLKTDPNRYACLMYSDIESDYEHF